MITSPFEEKTPHSKSLNKEGELYKIIDAYGKTFELRYGYYEENDRYSRYNEPVVIYPDFIENPVYTDSGTPFATAMQDPCSHFKGERDEDSTCYHCAHYNKYEELLGICTCPSNKKNE